MIRKSSFVLVALSWVLPGVAAATQRHTYTYAYAYVRHVEGTLRLQRATDAEPTDAGSNHPIMPGDRAWTGPQGRAEIQYNDGSLLRMDDATKVDFADFGEGGREALLRQWSGSIILRLS